MLEDKEKRRGNREKSNTPSFFFTGPWETVVFWMHTNVFLSPFLSFHLLLLFFLLSSSPSIFLSSFSSAMTWLDLKRRKEKPWNHEHASWIPSSFDRESFFTCKLILLRFPPVKGKSPKKQIEGSGLLLDALFQAKSRDREGNCSLSPLFSLLFFTSLILFFYCLISLFTIQLLLSEGNLSCFQDLRPSVSWQEHPHEKSDRDTQVTDVLATARILHTELWERHCNDFLFF